MGIVQSHGTLVSLNSKGKKGLLPTRCIVQKVR
ncbi:hypothetical protein Gohar_014518 [Gossypium harknessii]|uniref:Uncharacterized protein n=1 Tax=Gossypium harknessii TaxID=34285 RepID=A0A7J9FX34_9ROSI|nr:hypothetical protein [Gossypium harknessii]